MCTWRHLKVFVLALLAGSANASWRDIPVGPVPPKTQHDSPAAPLDARGTGNQPHWPGRREIYSKPEVEKWCRGGSFSHEGPNFGLARVTRDQSHFVRDWDNECPGDSRCDEKEYLNRGDLVATTRHYKQWTCVSHPQSNYTDWMKTSDLEPVEIESAPTLEKWIGEWKMDENDTIRLQVGKEPGTLEIAGRACWNGCRHTGAISAVSKPAGNRVIFRAYEICELSAVLLGDHLVATDNHECGGRT